MIAPLIFMLFVSSASVSLQKFDLKPSPPPARCKDACAERYRLPASSDDNASMKDRALADDGRKCNVVGAERCLSKRRTILRSTQDPVDTWRSALGQ